jgi:hypothetical protein
MEKKKKKRHALYAKRRRNPFEWKRKKPQPNDERNVNTIEGRK